ncbi:MAG: YggS family pyridoxal phosphate-dependent enzyme [Cyclobacteriaceae bacterium]|nr:YggS family pyridoxal phosphate-dependent enzyme [Cyclobacteriaceae bacterium]
MSEIAIKIEAYKKELAPYGAQLVAISKTKPLKAIREAYAAGQLAFGENKVQEMVEKHDLLPKDIQWHMVGHLQRNKVKYIAPFVHLIHSVDSIRLLQEINKEAGKNQRVISVLLQVHIAREETKFGFDMKEIRELLESDEFRAMNHLHVKGLMGMATNTDRKSQVEGEFAGLKSFLEELKVNATGKNTDFTELSMGMSGDYPIALKNGATLVRIGSSIFGDRNYE